MKAVAGAALYALWTVSVSLGFAQEQTKDRSYPALGTAIPVSMPYLSASRLKAGDQVVAKTTQIIDLSGEETVPRGAKLIGRVIEVQAGKPSVLTIEFDALHFHGQDLPVRVALRAMAAPTLGDSSKYGEPLDPSPTPVFMLFKQVGGDYFREREGPVYSSFGLKVGRSTSDGVFVRLFEEQPVQCTDHLLCPASSVVESVGVFSSESCGLYGMGSLAAEDVGSANPPGMAVRFTSARRTVHIPPGTPALFQVVGDATATNAGKQAAK